MAQVTRQTVEECAALDVRELVRKGRLRDGHSGELALPQGEAGVLAISFQVKDDWFDFDITSGDDTDTFPRNSVILSCPVGSPEAKKLSFLCPLCGEVVRKIYLPPGAGHFACRVCHGLSYKSRQSRVSEWDKTEARRAKLENILDSARPGCPRWVRALEEEERLAARMQVMLTDLVAERDRLFSEERKWERTHSAREAFKFPHRKLRYDFAWTGEEEPTPEKLPRGRPPKDKRDYRRTKPFLTTERENPAQGICFGCRDWREPLGPTVVTYANGRTALLGTCPVCGARMSRLMKGS